MTKARTRVIAAVLLSTVLPMVGCSSCGKPEDTSAQAFTITVTGVEFEYLASGTIEQGNQFSVVDGQGAGLGFTPSWATADRSMEGPVDLEVVFLKNAGTPDQSEREVSTVTLKPGIPGTIDPGDGEGLFKVTVVPVTAEPSST